MTNPLSVVNPDVLKENKSSIRSFLKDSYSNARKNIQDGVSFFKDEFSAFYNKTGTYLNQMMLPVNNYLKDNMEIETELHQAKSNDPAASSYGHLVPIEEALRSPMEENY
jgi:hypothetical protein